MDIFKYSWSRWWYCEFSWILCSSLLLIFLSPFSLFVEDCICVSCFGAILFSDTKGNACQISQMLLVLAVFKFLQFSLKNIQFFLNCKLLEAAIVIAVLCILWVWKKRVWGIIYYVVVEKFVALMILLIKFFDFTKFAAMEWGLDFTPSSRIVNEREVPLQINMILHYLHYGKHQCKFS